MSQRSAATPDDPSKRPSASPRDQDSTETERSTQTASSTDEGREGQAQADARSSVVSPEELSAAAARQSDPSASAESDADADPSDENRPDLTDLREELNDQFESIKILSPGQYELNLMELYDRDEYIISLREDGRYVIEVPGTWRGDDEV